MKPNIIIYTHMPNFSFIDGGTVVEYYLAQIIKEYGYNVFIYPSSGIKTPNPIFSLFYNNEFPIDDNAVVIYCEGTAGNPLNAKNVVRWMLSVLGQNVPYSMLNTWNKNELVYYFNSELKFLNHPEKKGIYKMLNCIYINPNISQKNFNERHGICYAIRKGPSIHKNNLFLMHPENSFEIHRGHSQKDYIDIFNNHKYFMCYDSNTFLIIIAALCGCIPIVYKVHGLSKQDWINTTAAKDYLNSKGLTNLYGIAYGHDDLPYAESTMHLAKEQWNEIVNFCKEQTIIPFLNDICNFQNMQNTIQNNY